MQFIAILYRENISFKLIQVDTNNFVFYAFNV